MGRIFFSLLNALQDIFSFLISLQDFFPQKRVMYLHLYCAYCSNRTTRDFVRELRDSKAYACLNSDLSEVLFHDVIFWDSKSRTFERDFSCFLWWNFLRFGGATC